jgi:probable HAF family extracellular repeat protein
MVLALAAPAAGAPPDGNAVFVRLRPEALAVATGANGFVIGGTFFNGGAFHWMPTSGVTEIGGLQVADVSRDGKTIVGNSLDANRLVNASIWTGGRTWRTLGSIRSARPCDASLSSAYGTNDDGSVIVGLAWDGCSYARAFRWEESTGMVDLGSLEGRSTRANAVSGDGRVVVGWDTDVTGFRRAAKWVDGREELLPAPGPSGLLGEAHGTNRDGSLIVGGGCNPVLPIPTAWSWTQATGVVCSRVTPPSWAIERPYQAIMFDTSDDGRVIGGALTFGLDAESVVWFDGEPFFLRDYLRSHGVPDAFEGWVNTGFVTDVSPDGRTLVGYAAGPTTFQGFLVILPELAR